MLKERTGLIKAKRSAGYEYRLSVKNFRKEASAMTVKDVIPFARSERIKVEWEKDYAISPPLP